MEIRWKTIKYRFFICDVCSMPIPYKGAVCSQCQRVPKTDKVYHCMQFRR